MPRVADAGGRARTRGRRGTAIRVSGIEPYEARGWRGVRADVDGVELRFETDGPPPAPSPEAFASALLVAALEARRDLALDDAVDRRWLRGVAEVARTFSAWWGYRGISILAEARDDVASPPSSATGLCFSGGADSFHALLRHPERIDAILTVQGFDMRWGDEARWEALSRSLEAIAGERGVRTVRLRTNLREHPLMTRLDWVRAHGGALAAVGHLSSPSIGRLVIAASVPGDEETPWGSHWRTDALWSSSAVTVAHWGHAWRRDQKLRDVCRERLVQEHLRVCWQNGAPVGNCGRCIKCLRTALILLDEGVLDRYADLASADSLPASLDALPTARRRWRAFEELLRKRSLPPDVHRALERLERRTRFANTPLGRLLRRDRRRPPKDTASAAAPAREPRR